MHHSQDPGEIAFADPAFGRHHFPRPSEERVSGASPGGSGSGVGGVGRPGGLGARLGGAESCSWSSHTQPTSTAPHSPWCRARRPALPFPAWSPLPWRGHACGLDWVPWQSQPCGLVREVPGSWAPLTCFSCAWPKQRTPFRSQTLPLATVHRPFPPGSKKASFQPLGLEASRKRSGCQGPTGAVPSSILTASLLSHPVFGKFPGPTQAR